MLGHHGAYFNHLHMLLLSYNFLYCIFHSSYSFQCIFIDITLLCGVFGAALYVCSHIPAYEFVCVGRCMCICAYEDKSLTLAIVPICF